MSVRGLLKRSSGFTLIEIAIVVAIIGLLLMIALPLYSGARVRAYVAEARQLTSEWKSLTWACLVEKSFDETKCDTATEVGWTPPGNSGAWKWSSAVMTCGAAASVSFTSTAAACGADQSASNAYVGLNVEKQTGVTGLNNSYLLVLWTAQGKIGESAADGTSVASP